MVAGFSKVTVWADGDDAGRGMAEKIARAVPIARILIMRAGQDVNSILVEGGPDALRRLHAGDAEPELIAAGVADRYDGPPPF
jgi:DNA primase